MDNIKNVKKNYIDMHNMLLYIMRIYSTIENTDFKMFLNLL